MKPQFSPRFKDVPFDDILKCVHCGLCSNDCPTYGELGTEQDSPRGRLYLMRGLWQGEIEPSPSVVAPLARCLDCRACETACPSNVPYGSLLEKTRSVLDKPMEGGWLRQKLVSFFVNRVLTSNRWLRVMGVSGWVYTKLGLPALITNRLFSPWLPQFLTRSHRLMPRFKPRSFKAGRSKSKKPTPGEGIPVHLFSGCVMDIAETDIHEASIQLLEAAGCQVEVPGDQGCCGALQVHSGYRQNARPLAKRNQRAFSENAERPIVVNSAGCGAQLKEYHHLFDEKGQQPDAQWQSFGSRVVDIMEFLNGLPDWLGRTHWKQAPVTVFYDAPCHLIHAQKIDQGPRALLSKLPQVTLVPLTDADRCCGAAGIYNLLNGDLAERILDRKLDDVAQCLKRFQQASMLLTANPGCLFQLRQGIKKRGLPLQVKHPITFMAERLEKAP